MEKTCSTADAPVRALSYKTSFAHHVSPRRRCRAAHRTSLRKQPLPELPCTFHGPHVHTKATETPGKCMNWSAATYLEDFVQHHLELLAPLLLLQLQAAAAARAIWCTKGARHQQEQCTRLVWPYRRQTERERERERERETTMLLSGRDVFRIEIFRWTSHAGATLPREKHTGEQVELRSLGRATAQPGAS